MPEHGTTVLETDRLVLRHLEPGDLDALAAIYADPAVMRFWPRPLTRQQTEANLVRLMRMYEDHGFGLWATIRKADGAFTGRCGLLPQEVNGEPEVEVAYLLGRQFWGQGFATEAAIASKLWAFRNLHARRVVSLIRPENAASVRVALRNGMRFWTETLHGGLVHHVYMTER